MTKVAVAMSGGVDSSVAAALTIEEYGKENVYGLTMKLFCYGEAETGEKSCCSLEAINDAKSVCDKLGIPHYVVNFEKEFEKEIIGDFISEYEAGRTPNPCIRCNRFIKFEYLLKKAKQLGADKLVTGHYARNEEKNGLYRLLKGRDDAKDQSYFLYALSQDQLKQTGFPLGDMEKTEVRETAAKLGLGTAQKAESQDICFIPGKIEEFLEEKATLESGEIVDKSGKIVGKHAGLAFYTIGQRKGLGGGFAEPVYVVEIDKQKNQIIVGPEESLLSSELTFSDECWVMEKPATPYGCAAKIRYNMVEQACTIEKDNKVVFDKPQRAITPGQSIVFYNNDEVLGGGTID